MVAISVTYQGNLQCEVVHGPSGTRLVTDAPADNGGEATSFSPTDLVATALGSCILTVMGLRAKALGIDIAGSTISVEKEMAAGPRRIASLTTTVRVPHTLSDNDRKQLEAAAHTCPVHKSLSPEIDAPITFTWG